MAQTTFAERALVMQGFRSDPAIRELVPWLRLTPSLSTLWITTGAALGSPAILFGFATLSAFGASQHRHPFDRLVRHTRLPDNPPPRRFAMGLAAAWAAAAATLLATGHRRAGRLAGALLAVAGGLVATTHFCVGSWVFRQLSRGSRSIR